MRKHNKIIEPIYLKQNAGKLSNRCAQRSCLVSQMIRTHLIAQIFPSLAFRNKGKGKVHPITGHEGPEGE